MNKGRFANNFVIPVFLFLFLLSFFKKNKMAMFLFFVTFLNSFSKIKH